MEQRTNDWYRARLGKFTASTIADLMVKGRGKNETFGKTALALIDKVAYERMLNADVVNDDDTFEVYLDMTDITTKAMRWGVENEPIARHLYKVSQGTEVVETGCVDHPDDLSLAASPDGLVGSDGCVEIKCVGAASFMRLRRVKDAATLLEAEPKYYWQVQAQLACTGRKWCDFVVYNPFVVQPLHVARIARNDEDIMEMEGRVRTAEVYIDEILKDVNKNLIK